MALKHTLAAVPAIAALTLAAFTLPAAAVTRQQVIVQFDPTPDDAFNSDETRDSDDINDAPPNAIDRALLAQIGVRDSNGIRQTPFVATGSVGEFGQLGVEGQTGAVGELDTQVFIESDDFVNITGRAQQARANFIIDGGRFEMIAGAGSLMEFALTVRKDFDTVFQTAFEFLAPAVGSPNQLTLFGEDIGIVQSDIFEVEIPLAFVSADLGVIQPNERFALSYQLDITATVVQFAEVVEFEFSDPFGVDLGDSVFPTVEFSDVQAVPSPPTAPLLLGAVGVFGLLTRRRNRTTA